MRFLQGGSVIFGSVCLFGNFGTSGSEFYCCVSQHHSFQGSCFFFLVQNLRVCPWVSEQHLLQDSLCNLPAIQEYRATGFSVLLVVSSIFICVFCFFHELQSGPSVRLNLHSHIVLLLVVLLNLTRPAENVEEILVDELEDPVVNPRKTIRHVVFRIATNPSALFIKWW